MKKILFALLFYSSVFGQTSILSNGSFETNPSCSYVVDSCQGWQRLAGQPVIASSCNATYPVPTNTFGSQSAFDGNSYLIIRTYSDSIASRQFVGSLLDNPITVGSSIHISLRMSLGDSCIYGSNNFCALFSVGSFINTTPFGGSDTFQLKTDTIVYDASGWTLLSGTFTATAPYDRVEFGNDLTDSQTMFDTANPSGSHPDARYFIDSIIVTETQPVSSDPPPPARIARLIQTTHIYGPIWADYFSDGTVKKRLVFE